MVQAFLAAFYIKTPEQNTSAPKMTRIVNGIREENIVFGYDSIVDKAVSYAKKHNMRFLSDEGGFGPTNPYGPLTYYRGQATKDDNHPIEMLTKDGWSYVSEDVVTKNKETINMYKVLMPKMTNEHAGKPNKDGKYRLLGTPKLLLPNQIVNQTYNIMCADPEKLVVENAIKYLHTQAIRYVIWITVTGASLSTSNFKNVPWEDFSDYSTIDWSKSIDEINIAILKKWGCTDEEIEKIDKTITRMPL